MDSQIILPGIAKSGTTYLTGKLSQAGFLMWGNKCEEHYEDTYMLERLRRIITCNNIDYWYNSFGFEDEIYSNVKELFVKFKQKNGRIGFKNPRLLLFMKELIQVFSDAKIIFCVRNMDDWLKSVQGNNRRLRTDSLKETMVKYYEYALGVINEYSKQGNVFVFLYDDGENLQHQQELKEFVNCNIDFSDFRRKTYA